MTRARLAMYLSAAAFAATVTACTGDTPARTGQQVEPVALTSIDAQGGVGGDVLTILAESSANDAVRVTAHTELAPSPSNDTEGDAIDALRAGEADLSVIRADRLATEGADSLATLQLPMLITSTEQADRVAADPVAEELMAGLDEIGLVGVALVPGGLRHPFGYNAPLYGPDDYRAHTFNTRTGAGVDAMFAALGATTDHSIDEVRSDQARSGALRGIEASLQQQGAVDRPAVLTSNVTLYTKFDVVVVRRETWNGLTRAQRDALRTVAVAAGAVAIDERDTEVEGLDRWCKLDGASSVTATPEQVDALRRALQSVVDAATADSAIKQLADRIAEMGAGTEPAAGRACGATTTDTASRASTTSPGTSAEAAPASTTLAIPSTSEWTYAVVPVGPQDVLDGVWRLDADREYMLSQGLSAQEAGANAGIWTIAIENGVADVDQPHGPNCLWQFAFDGNAISLNQGTPENDSCWGHMIGTYTLVGDVVNIHWDRNQDYDVALDNAMFHDGMHKIG